MILGEMCQLAVNELNSLSNTVVTATSLGSCNRRLDIFFMKMVDMGWYAGTSSCKSL